MSHYPEGFWCLVFLVLQSVIRYRYPKTLSILCFQHSSSESRHMRRENHVIQHMTAALTSTSGYQYTRQPKLPSLYHTPIARFHTLSLLSSYHHQQTCCPASRRDKPKLCHNLISSLLSYLFVLSQEHTFTMLILGCFLIPYAQHYTCCILSYALCFTCFYLAHTIMYYLVIVTGNPRVIRGYPYPYLVEPVPAPKGKGFNGYG